MIRYPTLEDYLLVAEAVLGIDAETLASAPRLGLAESALAAPQAHHFGHELYPDVAAKAAILCSRVVANHALPDGNKRVGFVIMLEFLARNGHEWIPPTGGQGEIAETIERLAGEPPRMSEDEFIAWVRGHTS